MKKKCTVFMEGYIDYLEDKKREAIEKAEAEKQKEEAEALKAHEIELAYDEHNPNVYSEVCIQQEMNKAWRTHMIDDGYALMFDAERSTEEAKKAYFATAMRCKEYPEWANELTVNSEVMSFEDYMKLAYLDEHAGEYDFYNTSFIIMGFNYNVEQDEVNGYFGMSAVCDDDKSSDEIMDEVRSLDWEFNRVDAVKHRKDKAGKRYNALLREKRHVKAIGAIANHRHFKDECEDYQYLLSPDKKFNYVRGPVVHPRQASWHDEKLQKNASKIRVVRHKAHKHVNKYKNMQKRANKKR